MNRGNLAEDPRAGLPSSSRYSRMGGEKRNALLYVDVRGRKDKKAAKDTGKTAEGNHNSNSGRSVGRGLPDSHMDRLEVGRDGRLFGVKEKNVKPAPKAPEKQIAKAEKTAVQPAVSRSDLFVNGLAAAEAPAETSGTAAAGSAAAASVKPERAYLTQANPLLAIRAKAAPSEKKFRLAGLAKWRTQLIAAAAAVLVAGYSYTAWHFRNRFYPGTEFFGIKAFDMSVYDVKAAIRDKVDSYSLELIAREPNESTDADTYASNRSNHNDTTDNIIEATDVDMTYVDRGQVDDAMKAQKSWLWPVMMVAQQLRSKQGTLETQYDRTRVDEVLDDLACFRKENIIAPENARITLTDDGAVVEPEVYGTTLDREAVAEAVEHALDAGLTELNLDRLGLYVNPTVFGGDLRLRNEAQELNKVLGAKIIMKFGDRTEVINSETVRTFLDKVDGEYRVSEEKVRSFAASLAEKYDTYGTDRTFYTSIGTSVDLDGSGDYGWELDQEAVSEGLLEAVLAQKKTVMDPVYTREAYCRSANDIGETYVEINITDQTMWFYKDGTLIVKTPVVTGNPYAGNATPSGSVWYLKGKFRNQLLSGEGYSAPVDYWMPFNGGVGIHDLQSRWYFGGNVYLGSGSHGCINTPLSAVKLIYANIEEGVPIIVYEDDSETAQELMTGPVDSATIKAEVEEEFGTVEDDGSGSIVYWTAQQKAAAATSSAAVQSAASWQ